MGKVPEQGGYYMPVSKATGAKKHIGPDRGGALKDMLDMLPIQTAILSGDGRIMFANRALRSDTGLQEGGMIFDSLSPSSIQETLTALKGVERSGKTAMITITMAHEAGDESIAMHMRGLGKAYNGGSLCMIIPAKPSPSSTHLESIISSLEVPAQLIRSDLSVVVSNDRIRDELGWIGRKKNQFKAENERRKEFLKGCFRSGTGGDIEFTIGEKGRTTRYHMIASMVGDERDDQMLLELWLDVTSIGSETPADSTAGDLYDEMLDTSNAVVIGLDKEGIVRLFNKGAQRALGYSRESVVGRSWFDYMADPGTAKGALDVFQWNINTGFRTRFENRIRSSSGDPVTISWENTVIFDSRGKIRTILMIGQDITQMKRLEESLVQRTEELARALEEAGIYNDLMLHDIHNSTAAIMGYLELMDLKGLSAEKRKEYGSRALSEVKKSAGIVKEVRLISRIESSTEVHPVKLRSAFPRISERSKALSGKGTTLQTELKDLSVMADEHLEEGILRIVDYIIRTSQDSPKRIIIQARRAPSFSGQINNPVLISVKVPDLKIGREEVEALFRTAPRRGDLSDRLGMYLIRRVIDRYGGSLWVEDEEGTGGSTINILVREAI